LQGLDDEVEVALELQAVGSEERLEEFTEVHVDGSGACWSKARTVSGTRRCDTA
jgi:hypothetical protein